MEYDIFLSAVFSEFQDYLTSNSSCQLYLICTIRHVIFVPPKVNKKPTLKTEWEIRHKALFL